MAVLVLTCEATYHEKNPNYKGVMTKTKKCWKPCLTDFPALYLNILSDHLASHCSSIFCAVNMVVLVQRLSERISQHIIMYVISLSEGFYIHVHEHVLTHVYILIIFMFCCLVRNFVVYI